MADCTEVCRSREFAKLFDDNDLTNWYVLHSRISLINRMVCDIIHCTKLIVHASGMGGYDECIKYLNSKMVFAICLISKRVVSVRSNQGNCN